MLLLKIIYLRSNLRKESPIGYKWVDGARIKDIDFKKAAENACYFAKVRYNLAKKLMSGQKQLTHNEITELLGKKPNWVKTNLKRIFK